MKILQYALEFLRMGISVIPLHHRSKEPYLKAWQPYQTHRNTEYELLNWFGSGWCNYGVIAGWNNLAFLDFDDFEIFALWKSYMELVKLPMPYVVLSSRGAHVYISLSARGANQKRRGVDVKYRGYVVGAGSVHPSGTMYMPINELHLAQVESLDAILPVELFPFVAPSPCFNGTANLIQPHTEYQLDPFTAAGMDLISKVKAAVRIESFFADVQKSSYDGRWYKTLCPFHDDHNPSMWIDTARQLCGCQVCGMKPLDVINLYARQHNVTESAAVTMMAREVGM